MEPPLAEALEPRLLLAAGPLISEFMANNVSSRPDGDGRFSDWIELLNPTAAPINLEGWYLTDDLTDLTRWRLPAASIEPGGRLLIFASGRSVNNYVDPAGYLHTNFQLNADGESVALVMPDGRTIAHAFRYYPPQLPDVSYGITGLTTTEEAILPAGSQVRYHVPTAGEDALAWTARTYNDAGWVSSFRADAAGLLITEVCTGQPRVVEIQNVSDAVVDTAGWRVLANSASGGINSVNAASWPLPSTVAAGQVLYRTDSTGDQYWGGTIDWAVDGSGWAMIIDDAGLVMDFVAWGYTAAQIATLDVSYDVFGHIRPTGQWSGNGAAAGTAGGGSAQGFVAFNDHIAGTGTHANTTRYDAHSGTADPASGLLKDITTGQNTSVTLTVSATTNVGYADEQKYPSAGTDAYAIFNGYVDFDHGSKASIELGATSAAYTYTFTRLDTGATVTYDFAGTAVRGDRLGSAPYPDRWTLVTLEGVDAATPAHTSGVGVVRVNNYQVAIWTGDNSQPTQGFVARWTGIDPGTDGQFSVISNHYTGSTPGVGTGIASGSKGYAITGLRLTENVPAGPLAWLKRVGNADGDGASDFVRALQGTKGSQNDDLIAPFGSVVAARTAVGFSGGDAQYQALIATDVAAAMQGINASAWVRMSFDAGDLASYDGLTLRMRYDDGFIAYLNGTPIASRNAPGTPAWNSPAPADRPNSQAVTVESIDVSQWLGLLQPTGNVLAIHALNHGAADADLLMLPELVLAGTTFDAQPRYFLAPTPQGPNGTGYEYPGVVINEIHSDPDVKTQLVEFIELYNGGPAAADVGGWYFDAGIQYTFPQGATIPSGGYLVVTQNPTQFQAKFGRTALGPWIGSLDNDGEEVTLRNRAFQIADQVNYGLAFPWPTVGEAPGRSMQLISPGLDNDLGGSWRSGTPTPGARNSCYASNAAPQLRQVQHLPKQPVGGEPVKVTVKATDPDGVAGVTLQYQLVEPGAYIQCTDPAYATNWTNVAMVDDGTGGDDCAGDGVYTVILPASLQMHRRLVRYRIVAADDSDSALAITAPYADDPGRNFAYYVYDGVPSWSGAIHPGDPDPAKAQVVTYSSDVLTRVPVYQLLTTRTAHEQAMYIPNSTSAKYDYEDYPWIGTFVYDGEVYDHIHYRARGGCWRYAMGKNMWKFDFNQGHPFQAMDNWGNKYATKWDKLNFSACIQQGDYLHRGEQGMLEAAGFKLFNLLGVEAPNTHWVHFRIVEGANQNGPNQYSGDFQALYLVIEQMDGEFLDEHGLPDGNLYKIEGYNGTLNNQGPTAVTNGSDCNAFKAVWYNDPNPTEAWWRQNVDLESYYSYRAVVEMIHHGDIGYGKNYFFYLNPETNIWSMLPWDLDLTWATNMYGNGEDPFRSQGAIFSNANLLLEYKNRLREVMDLLYNSAVMYPLLDELANLIDDPGGGPSIVDADRAMWDYNPILASSYVNSSKAGWGRFYQQAATKDFRGMVQIMKSYVVSPSRSFATDLTDPNLPNTPTLTYTGPAGYPLNRLSFRSSAFSDLTGSFAAMEWRIAEVTDPAAPAYDPTKPRKFEITPLWESGELTVYSNAMTVPPANLEPGHAYRARVRMKDSTGRWSHWSAPVQFIAGDPTGTALTQFLRVTEVMYQPPPDPSGTYDADQFEFIELRNTGATTLNISHVTFTAGVTYSFSGSAVTNLAAGQRVVVARDPVAFAARYDTTGMLIVGPYTGKLNDDGETIALADGADGPIHSFRYEPTWFDQTRGEGFSLTILNDTAPTAAWDLMSNWKASWSYGGTPGKADTGVAPGSVVIHEVLAHNDQPSGDWIELHNTTGSPINVGGWFLSDEATDILGNPALGKYQIPTDRPAETTIAAGDYLVVTESGWFGGAFALGEHGDDVYLTSNDNGRPGGYREHVDFEASPNSVTFGLYAKSDGRTDFTLLSSPTPGEPNAAPYVGPVVISEVMYAPSAGRPEYVEVYNRTSSAVPLYDPDHPQNTWRLAGGVAFSFPPGVIIPPHGCILVAETTAAALRAAYGLGGDAVIFGPYTGKLDNAGEDVWLERPDRPDPITGYVPFIREDWVRYDDASPWPQDPATGLASLSRIEPGDYGNDLINWEAGGTPGQPNQPPPTVMEFVRNDGADRPSELLRASFRFSEDVSESLDVSDLHLCNVSTGLDVDLAAAVMAYDPVTNTARWDLTGVAIQAGYHSLALFGEEVTSGDGLPLGGQDPVGFETTILVAMPGDANLDGRVGREDLLALKQHLGQDDSVWSWGDFDYSGMVDVLDYLVVKISYGKELAAPPPKALGGDLPAMAAEELPETAVGQTIVEAKPLQSPAPPQAALEQPLAAAGPSSEQGSRSPAAAASAPAEPATILRPDTGEVPNAGTEASAARCEPEVPPEVIACEPDHDDVFRQAGLASHPGAVVLDVLAACRCLGTMEASQARARPTFRVSKLLSLEVLL